MCTNMASSGLRSRVENALLIVRTTGDFGDVTKIIKEMQSLSPEVTFYDV